MVGFAVAVNVAVGVGVAVGVAVAVGVGVCVGASAKTFHAVVGPYKRSEKTAATSTAAVNATAPPTRRNSARRVIVPLPSRARRFLRLLQRSTATESQPSALHSPSSTTTERGDSMVAPSYSLLRVGL